MSSDSHSQSVAPLDLSRWRGAPVKAIIAGVVLAVIGVGLSRVTAPDQIAFSWLVAYMFFLSLCMGGLFLVIVHHLFDASWSVATRRVCEHLACLAGWPMLILFLPNALHANILYQWMRDLGHPNHSLKAKFPLFTLPGFYIGAAICFACWWFWSNRLRYWSLEQDKTGAAYCTRRMRFFACTGVVMFALTLTFAAIMWMKALMYEWFSTMYGVTYFAGSVWMTLATVYIITMVLQRTTVLREIVKEKTYYMIGSLMFAFTVFWAYVNFSQYFIVWNANMPEETFWYVLREKGTWWFTGAIIIIFGHFFVPFLALLRIDVKLKLATMLPICCWIWLMHYIDMEFQIMPALHSDGVWHWVGGFIPVPSGSVIADIGCMLIIGGILAIIFLRSLNSHPVYPLKDPRIAETMDVYVRPASEVEPVAKHAK